MSFDNTQIKLRVFAPSNTGGDDITAYELQIDEGSLNSDFSKVQSFADAGGD